MRPTIHSAEICVVSRFWRIQRCRRGLYVADGSPSRVRNSWRAAISQRMLAGCVRRSLCVMKNDAERMALSGSDATDAVAQVHARGAPRPLYGPIVNREDDGVTLA